MLRRFDNGTATFDNETAHGASGSRFERRRLAVDAGAWHTRTPPGGPTGTPPISDADEDMMQAHEDTDDVTGHGNDYYASTNNNGSRLSQVGLV